MRRLAVMISGVGIGVALTVIGCVALQGDAKVFVDRAVSAYCMQQLGACGQKSVWYNRCTRRVVIYDADGLVVQQLQAFEIADRPGVEQRPPDAPKLTKAWRCKKREGVTYCHLYRAAASVFGAFVHQNFLSLTEQPWSRRWCTPDAGCAPMETEL